MPRRKKAYIIDEDGMHRPGSSSTSAAHVQEETGSLSPGPGPGPGRRSRDAGKSSSASKQRRHPKPSVAKGKAPENYRRPREKSTSFKSHNRKDRSPEVVLSRSPRPYHRSYNSRPDRNSYNGYPNYYAQNPPPMVPYGYGPYNAAFTPAPAPAGGLSYFGESYPAHMAQFLYSAPPPPPEEVAPPKTPAPAPSQENTKEQKERNEEIDKLKQMVANYEKQYEERLQKEQQRETDQEIRRQAELTALEMVRAREDAYQEIERVKQEAERKAREDVEAEKRAYEERLRLYRADVERVQKETREKLEREHEAQIEKEKREAEEHQRLVKEAEARMMEELHSRREKEEENRRLLREKEEENQRLLKEKEEEYQRRVREEKAKLAQELEDRHKRQEQEEEEKRKMFQQLKAELHVDLRAELMEGESRYLNSSLSGFGSKTSYGTTATSQSSVDPFEFYDGQSTPGFDLPRKPSKRQDAYWGWGQSPVDRSYQAHVFNAMSQNFGHVNPDIRRAYKDYGWRPRPGHSEGGSSRGSRAGHDVRRSHYQSPNAQPRLPKVSADDDDSDKGTVIPSSSHKARTQSTKGNDASDARGGPFQLNQFSGNQPLDIQVGLETIRISNGNSASPMENHPSPQSIGDRLNKTITQVDTPWAIAPLEDENKGKGKEAETGYMPGPSRENMPDPDGGVDLTSSNLTNLTAPQPSPNKILPENPGDDASRDSPKAAQLDQPVRPSPVSRQATRDSPLLPLLAKHVSDFERDAEHKRLSNLSRQAPSSTSTDTEDDYQNPYPPDAAAWPSWPTNDVPAHLFPYYMGRQENWPAYGPQYRHMDDSRSEGSDYTYEPEAPMALVPCIMLPLHMVQSSMRAPMMYPGMMQPRRSRRRQPSNLQSEYDP